MQRQNSMQATPADYMWGESVITELLGLISREEDFDSIGAEMLRLTGKNFDADYCYVFQYTDASLADPVQLFNWINPLAKHTKPDTQSSRFDVYRDKLLARQPVIVSASELEDGMQLRVICGIWLGEKLYGFIGLDYLKDAQKFTCYHMSVMNNIANLFAIAFKQTHQYEQLQDSVSLRRQIMDNMPLPILLVDLNYRVRAANPTKKIGVYKPLSQLLGSYCYDTVCKFGSPPDFCSVCDTLRTKQSSRKEFSFNGKRLISTSQPIFDRNGEMQYVLSVDIDITEVAHQKEELELAMKQAQAANNAKSYFLATVSHELRTPLNAVIGFSELLQESDIDEHTRKDYLRSINFAGTALLNLINDVLDLSNLEANQTLIAPVKTDLVEVLQQIVGVFKLKALQKNIELVLDVSKVRHAIYVDNQRLRQIILNLIGNAIKFTEKGSVTVKASFTPKDNDRGLLSISISDTGIGISAENKEKVFEPFVHDSIMRGKRMYEGSGLGLTISRRLLDKMGGTIKLDSELGKGCTFTIELDVRFDNALQTHLESTDAEISSRGLPKTGSPMRALLIDDVPINLKVLEAMLKRMNVSSSMADSVEGALALLSMDRDYDVIMTDMWMPNSNGIELAERIRSELGIKDIPIMAITADTEITQKDNEIFTHIIYKPITAESLKKALEFVYKT